MRLWALYSTSYCVTNPQWGHENISAGAGACGRSMGLPDTDLMDTVSPPGSIAKLRPSPIESRNSLMVVTTSETSIGSSPIGESTNSWSFIAGMAPTLSETYTSRSCFMASTSLQSTVTTSPNDARAGAPYFSQARRRRESVITRAARGPPGMRDSECFGAERGHGREVVDWINGQALKRHYRLEARLYGGGIETDNFGAFEMFSWVGDVRNARSLVVKASKKFGVRVLEGGYKPRERVLRLRRFDYALVRRGDRVIGHLELEAPMFGGSWAVRAEERR